MVVHDITFDSFLFTLKRGWPLGKLFKRELD